MSQRRSFPPCHTVAVLLTVAVILALGVLLAWDIRLAARWAAEDNVIEWTQVGLFAGAFALGARGLTRLPVAGRGAAMDLLLTFFFGVLLIGELDLDYRLFGVHVVGTRFFTKPAVWLPYKILAALIIGGVYLAVGAFAFRHRRDVWQETRRLTTESWGQLFLAGAAIFGFAQLFERQLNHWFLLPRNFFEESLELIAAIYFLLAMIERSRSTREPPG